MRRGLVLCALGFIALELLLVAFVDRPLSVYLRGLDQSHPQLIDFFRAYTDLGKSKWYLWPAGFGIAVCAIFTRMKFPIQQQRDFVARAGHRLVFFFASLAISGLVADAIKPLIGRARPVELAREGLYGFHPISFQAAWNSMPSGHTVTAAAFAVVCSFLFPRARVLWWVCCVAIAVSRVMVNAHYLSDVLAGLLIGVSTVRILARRRDGHGMFPMLGVFFPLTKSCPYPKVRHKE